MNSFDKIWYSGPFPPMVRFTATTSILWLDAVLTLTAGSGKDELVRTMAGYVVQYGETFVQYGRWFIFSAE
jgi:hypothetical protein